MSEQQTVAGKIRAKLNSGKLLEIIAVIALIAAVVLIVLMNFSGENKTVNASGEDYAASLETRLASVLSQMRGAGNVYVFITIDSEGEKVIATESTVNADGSVTETPVLSGGEVIVLEEKNPEITGVLIVAEGADDLNVRFNLLEATASVLDIDQSIVKVYAKAK